MFVLRRSSLTTSKYLLQIVLYKAVKAYLSYIFISSCRLLKSAWTTSLYLISAVIYNSIHYFTSILFMFYLQSRSTCIITGLPLVAKYREDSTVPAKLRLNTDRLPIEYCNNSSIKDTLSVLINSQSGVTPSISQAVISAPLSNRRLIMPLSPFYIAC